MTQVLELSDKDFKTAIVKCSMDHAYSGKED